MEKEDKYIEDELASLENETNILLESEREEVEKVRI